MLEQNLEEYQKEFEAKYQTFENMYNNKVFNLEDFNHKYNEIVENLQTTHGKIIEDISKKKKKNNFKYIKVIYLFPQ